MTSPGSGFPGDLALWYDDNVSGPYNALAWRVDWEKKINMAGDPPYKAPRGAILWRWCGDACRGSESEWGERSAEREGIRAWMRLWNLEVPPAPAALAARVIEQLAGMLLGRIVVELGRLALVFVAPEQHEERATLRCEIDHPRVDLAGTEPGGLMPDEHLVVALMEVLCARMEAARFDDAGALVLAWASTRIHFPREWPLHEDGWRLKAAAGDHAEIVAGNGGALRLIASK